MITQALKQLWIQRKKNIWLLIELVVVFIVILMLSKSIFELVYFSSITPGYKSEQLYLVRYNNSLSPKAIDYDPARASVKAMNEDIARVAMFLKGEPIIDAVAIHGADHPNGYSYHGVGVTNMGDSVMSSAQVMTYIKGWNYWNVYNYTSANSSDLFISDNDDGAIITKDLERILLKKINEDGVNSMIQKRIKITDEKDKDITGVVNYIKRNAQYEPRPVIIMGRDSLDESEFSYGSATIAIRFKEGTTFNQIDDIKNILESEQKFGNIRVEDFISMEDSNKDYKDSNNETSIGNLLIMFLLSIIFLGVVSSFWIKVQTNRGEIGLRMAIGASKGKIVKQFLAEGLALVTISSIIGVILSINFLYIVDAMKYRLTNYPEFWPVGNPYANFVIITLITFSLITITVLVGTIFPTFISTKIKPADALRDE